MHGPASASLGCAQEAKEFIYNKGNITSAPWGSEEAVQHCGTGFQVEAVSLSLQYKAPGPSAVLPGSVTHLKARIKPKCFPCEIVLAPDASCLRRELS